MPSYKGEELCYYSELHNYRLCRIIRNCPISIGTWLKKLLEPQNNNTVSSDVNSDIKFEKFADFLCRKVDFQEDWSNDSVI